MSLVMKLEYKALAKHAGHDVCVNTHSGVKVLLICRTCDINITQCALSLREEIQEKIDEYKSVSDESLKVKGWIEALEYVIHILDRRGE